MNILLLPEGETASLMARRLCEWSAARLMDPFCIWIASDGAEEEERTLRVARVVGGVEEELELAAALDGVHVRDIRMLACYPLAAEEVADDAFPAAVESFVGTARREVLDFDRTAPATCTMAVMPERSSQAVRAGVFRTRWAGLLVAPEDRVRPGMSNQLSRDGQDRFIAHTAHAAAAIAELWSAPDGQRTDLIGRLRSEPLGALPVRVRVVRSFSRLVEFGYVADHVAETAFAIQDGWPRPDPERFERPRDPEPLIEQLVELFVEKHRMTLECRPFEPVQEDRPKQLTLLEALRELRARFQIWLEHKPVELVEDAKAVIYNKAVDYIQRLAGRDGEIQILRWGELPQEERGLDRLRAQVERQGQLTVEDGPVARTWRDLRLLTFGIVDGSTLPEGLGEETLKHGQFRYVICDPSLIANAPDAGEAPEDTEEVLEPPLLERVRSELAAAVQRARAMEKVLIERRDDRSANRQDEVSAVPEPSTGNGLQRRLHERRRARARRGRVASLLHRVLQGAAVAFAAMLAAWVLLAPVQALAVSAIVVLAWLVWSGEMARRALVLPRLSDDARAMRELRDLNDALALAQASGDRVRLERRLEEIADWIEILAELVHRPWLGGLGDDQAVERALDLQTLPAAFGVGVAKPDRQAIERLGANVRKKAFQQGWMSTIYRVVVELAKSDYASASGSAPELMLDPSADVSQDPQPYRKALLDRVKTGEGRFFQESPLTGELLRAIDATSLDALGPLVVEAGQGVLPLGPTVTRMTRPAGTDEIMSAIAQRICLLGSGAAVGVALAPRLVLTAKAALAEPRAANVVKIWLPTGTELALLELDRDIESVADGDPLELSEPAHGMSIITVGVERGRLVPRWGLILYAGGQARAVCNQGLPCPGAPVLSLEGRLLAVHDREGGLLRAADAETLRAHSPEPVLSVAAALGAELGSTEVDAEETSGPSASEFLSAIVREDGDSTFSPEYWVGTTQENSADPDFSAPIASIVGEATVVDRVTERARFGVSLRAITHVVEVSYPVDPPSLTACALVSESLRQGATGGH